jgi:hypothetical protein
MPVFMKRHVFWDVIEDEEVSEELGTPIFRGLRRPRTRRRNYFDGRCGRVCDTISDPKSVVRRSSKCESACLQIEIFHARFWKLLRFLWRLEISLFYIDCLSIHGI